jgi:hypothetical protein
MRINSLASVMHIVPEPKLTGGKSKSGDGPWHLHYGGKTLCGRYTSGTNGEESYNPPLTPERLDFSTCRRCLQIAAKKAQKEKP